ncbi:hypothetical protein HYPSUDRAFT_45262 [Hypholoma sublateritium FD-334 SS-4]|uniref:Uncharacterized protein n=1 Tax=Hypholoma sublateritium (strain FD-334 SS-4) TaxID=945553 RepID=A0A0D2NNP6_HYPSF|nr:hypothetical protein HYPSUDRAFT_45262 [Hypholoma sublateritium FD-334 SS-4]
MHSARRCHFPISVYKQRCTQPLEFNVLFNRAAWNSTRAERHKETTKEFAFSGVSGRSSNVSKTSIIIGVSSGMERVVVKHILEKGHTARTQRPLGPDATVEALADQLLNLSLDVVYPLNVLETFVSAFAMFSRVDVVYNDVSFSSIVEVEGTSENDFRRAPPVGGKHLGRDECRRRVACSATRTHRAAAGWSRRSAWRAYFVSEIGYHSAAQVSVALSLAHGSGPVVEGSYGLFLREGPRKGS